MNLKETIGKSGVTTVCVMNGSDDALELEERIAVMYLRVVRAEISN